MKETRPWRDRARRAGYRHSWLKKKDGSPFSTFQRPIIPIELDGSFGSHAVRYVHPTATHLRADRCATCLERPGWRRFWACALCYAHGSVQKAATLWGDEDGELQTTVHVPDAAGRNSQVPSFVQKISTGSGKPPILDYIDSFSL